MIVTRAELSARDEPVCTALYTIVVRQTIIDLRNHHQGKGSPNKAGSHDCHGSALGDAEVAVTRAAIGWPHAPFEIPADVYAGWDQKAKGSKLEGEWNAKFEAYAKAFPKKLRNSNAVWQVICQLTGNRQLMH